MGHPQPATHSLSRVVLPKPAGAETRVSLRCSPASSRSIRRGRGTHSDRAGGVYSLVLKSGVDIALSSGFPWMGLSYHSLAVPTRSARPVRGVVLSARRTGSRAELCESPAVLEDAVERLSEALSGDCGACQRALSGACLRGVGSGGVGGGRTPQAAAGKAAMSLLVTDRSLFVSRQHQAGVLSTQPE